MKLGLISDVHGNAIALRACLNVLTSLDVDEIRFLGDVVGYIPGEGECLEMLDAAGVVCQQGNHEAMLLEPTARSIEVDSVYRLADVRHRMAPSTVELIRTWPITCDLEMGGRRLLLVHGSPADPLYGRIYPDGDVNAAEQPGFDAVFMGQTHRPFVAGSKHILVANVGSVGLPRDVGDLSSFVVYDTETNLCSVQRVRFDVAKVIRRWGHDMHESTIACLHRVTVEFVGAVVG